MIRQDARPIVIATRPGFFARHHLRSPLFEQLHETGRPIAVIWPEPNDEGVAGEFDMDGVSVVEMPDTTEPDATDQAVPGAAARWVRDLRLYVRPHGVESTAHDQRLEHRLVAASEGGLGTRIFWGFQRACVGVFERSRPLRAAALAFERRFDPNLSARDTLRTLRPCVVVTGSPGYAPWFSDAHLIRAARELGVPSVCPVLSWDNPSTKGFLGAAPDRLLVWTDTMADEFVEFHDLAGDRVKVTGTTLTDTYVRLREQATLALPADLTLEPGRKTILVGTMSPRYRYNVDVVRTLLEAADGGAFSMPVQWIVRPHPLNYVSGRGNDLEGLAELAAKHPFVQLAHAQNLHPDRMDLSWTDVEEMASLIKASDVVLSFFSTMMIEAALMDRPIINVGYDEGPVSGSEKSLSQIPSNRHVARILATGGARVGDSPEHLVSEINRYLDDPSLDAEGRRRIVANEAGPLDGRATERIVNEILEAASLCPAWAS